MKFLIRRSIVGLIAIPFIAGAYVFFYLFIILSGAEPSIGLEDAFNNGLLIGFTSALFFAFYPQVSKLLDKILN